MVCNGYEWKDWFKWSVLGLFSGVRACDDDFAFGDFEQGDVEIGLFVIGCEGDEALCALRQLGSPCGDAIDKEPDVIDFLACASQIFLVHSKPPMVKIALYLHGLCQVKHII